MCNLCCIISLKPPCDVFEQEGPNDSEDAETEILEREFAKRKRELDEIASQLSRKRVRRGYAAQQLHPVPLAVPFVCDDTRQPMATVASRPSISLNTSVAEPPSITNHTDRTQLLELASENIALKHRVAELELQLVSSEQRPSLPLDFDLERAVEALATVRI